MLSKLRDFSHSYLTRQTHNSAKLLSFNASKSTDWSVVDLLLYSEGKVRGKMVREKRMGDNEKREIIQKLEGREIISVEGVRSAFLRARPAFIQGLLEGLERPHDSLNLHRRHIHIQNQSRLRLHSGFSAQIGRPIYLKDEGRLPGRSIHYRGALQFLILALESGIDPEKIHLVTASLGKFALGLAQAAKHLGFKQPILVFTSREISYENRKMLGTAEGIEVMSSVNYFLEAKKNAQRFAEEHLNYLFVPPTDHATMAMGHGTIGIEIDQELSDYGVLISTKTPSTLAGVSAYLAPQGVPVYGVESWIHPNISKAFEYRRNSLLGDVEEEKYLKNGVSDFTVEESLFDAIYQNVRDILLISRSEMQATSAHLLRDHDIAISPYEAAPLASLLFGGLQTSCGDRLPSHLPLVVILTSSSGNKQALRNKLDYFLTDECDWQIGIMGRLYLTFLQKKFLAKETPPFYVHDIPTVGEGIDIVDTTVPLVPYGKDLLDVLALIDFGPHRPDGEKDINATLRSLGMFRERWNGCKGESLFHPLTGRGTVLSGYVQLLEEMKRKPARLRKERLRYQSTISRAESYFNRVHPRVVVETYVVNLFLQRPNWLKRLWPNLEEDKRQERISQLKELNEKVKLAVRTLTQFF